MPWGIKVATRKSVERNGELSDDANIWTSLYRYERMPFDTEAEAMKFADLMTEESDDRRYIYRPVEFK